MGCLHQRSAGRRLGRHLQDSGSCPQSQYQGQERTKSGHKNTLQTSTRAPASLPGGYYNSSGAQKGREQAHLKGHGLCPIPADSLARNMPRGQAQQAKKGPTTGPRRQDPGGNLGVEREPVLVPDSTWADDSAFPLRDDNPKLLATAEFAAPLDLSPHELPGAGNDPNLKPSKAAPVLRFAGKGAQAARRCFLADAKPQLWRLPDTQVSISTTPAYTHVGGVLDHRASMLPEARRRLSIASTSTSYDEGKALLYGNNTIALPVRVAVFEAAIRPSCFNVALWLPVGRAWKKLENRYIKILRRLLATHFRGEALFKLPSSVVHALTASFPTCPSSEIWFLFCSLVSAGPPGLWAMLQLEQTWCQAVQKDLAWLRDREDDSAKRIKEKFRPN